MKKLPCFLVLLFLLTGCNISKQPPFTEIGIEGDKIKAFTLTRADFEKQFDYFANTLDVQEINELDRTEIGDSILYTQDFNNGISITLFVTPDEKDTPERITGITLTATDTGDFKKYVKCVYLSLYPISNENEFTDFWTSMQNFKANDYLTTIEIETPFYSFANICAAKGTKRDGKTRIIFIASDNSY